MLIVLKATLKRRSLVGHKYNPNSPNSTMNRLEIVFQNLITKRRRSQRRLNKKDSVEGEGGKRGGHKDMKEWRRKLHMDSSLSRISFFLVANILCNVIAHNIVVLTPVDGCGVRRPVSDFVKGRYCRCHGQCCYPVVLVLFDERSHSRVEAWASE